MRGRARKSHRTKDLLLRLCPGEFAVVDHQDLDDVAAAGLLERGPRAVLNAAPFTTGRYPAPGPRRLAAAGVYLVETLGRDFLERVHDGDWIELRGSEVWRDGCPLARGRRVRARELALREAAGRERLDDELAKFLTNTLRRASREQSVVLGHFPLPPLTTGLRGRPAVVVVRGPDHRADLDVLLPFVHAARPVLIGVDGGADALLAAGLRPDIIVGDMDSVSDPALRCGAELVVHAYPNGLAPGMARLSALQLAASPLPAPGTSEDVALLLAFEAGAEPIVAVGGHRGLVDFLEKGRAGMASTLLVRLKLGHVLVDARGISRLCRDRGGVCTASAWPFAPLTPEPDLPAACAGPDGSGMPAVAWRR